MQKTRPPVKRKGSRVTLQDVAQLAECSVSTVSAVLSNRQYCWASNKTRHRIKEAAGQLGYRPNLAARSLRGGATQTLGMLTTALNIEVTSAKVEAFEHAARTAGYVSMFSFVADDDADEEDRLILKHLDRHVDGLAVYPTEQGAHHQLRKLVSRGYPLVTIDGADRIGFECDDVSMDYLAAGRMQVEHLLAAGRRKLCHINTLPTCVAKDLLRQGAVEAMAKAGLPKPTLLDIDTPPTIGSQITPELCDRLRDLLTKHRGDIDAIISYDLIAAACHRVCIEMKIAVPEEMAIIGFDGAPVAVNSIIPLTTVGQPTGRIGDEAFRLVKKRIDAPGVGDFEQVRVPPALLQGRTTTC